MKPLHLSLLGPVSLMVACAQPLGGEGGAGGGEGDGGDGGAASTSVATGTGSTGTSTSSGTTSSATTSAGTTTNTSASGVTTAGSGPSSSASSGPTSSAASGGGCTIDEFPCFDMGCGVLCDGVPDCAFGEDELFCDMSGSGSTSSGGNVPPEWICDPNYYSDIDCDCGCGVQDPACANADVASCDYCSFGCSTQTDCSEINPTMNWLCTM